MAVIYGLKVNLSVAMVSMVNNSAIVELNPHHHQVINSTPAIINATAKVSDSVVTEASPQDDCQESLSTTSDTEVSSN